jgi:four helix bundle protein
VYILSDRLPSTEIFVLKNQIRRASISVVSNIAEGSARKSTADRKRFYEIARSSAIEIDAQIETSIALNYFQKPDSDAAKSLLSEVFKMLSKMIS